MLNKLDLAKKYLKLGWSVIPVKNKIPQLSTWEPYQKNLASPQELDRWFGGTSDNGIGIVTGSLSNLTVIDVDTITMCESLQRIHSPISVRTPRGRHLYFQYEKGVKNHVEIFEHVDIRSEGGFVVAPGSAGYDWANPYFRVDSLPKFPLHLLPKTETIQRNETGWIAESLKGLKEGNRDDTFTSIIGRLHRDNYAAPDIFVLLAPYAEDSGFGNDELNKKIDHILATYPNQKSVTVHDDSSDSFSDFMADIKPIEWLCKPLIGRSTIGFCAGLPETLKTWLMADLAIEVARGGKWLGKFPVEQGKVLFIDQERYKGEVQRRFKLLLGEKKINTEDLEQNLVIKSQTTTRLDLDESFAAFRKKLFEIRPDLIIVDSFATWHTREENNRKDIQTVLERIKQIRTEFGCTVLMIDHENKSVFDKEDVGVLPNAFKMAGSVGKPAAAETVFTVRKASENEVVLYHTKSTIAPTIEPVKVSILDTASGVILSC